MREATRVGNCHVLCSGNTDRSAHRRRSVSKTILNSAAGVVAAGLMSFSAPHAQANISLFTTADDFALDTGDGNGWTAQSGATIGASTAYDSDSSTTNGVGNTTNAGGTGTAGSLQINLNSSISYNTLAQAPKNDQSNQAFFSALDPGSIAAYSAGSGYGAGTETAYSGTLQYNYTVPTISSGGGYLVAGLVLNDGSSLGFRRTFATSTINDGTVDGLSTYTATIPYSFAAGSFGFFQFGIVFNTDYVPSGPLYIDNIQVVSAPATPAGQAHWITNGNGSWTTDANWNTSAPTVAGTSAVFDSEGGTITVNPTITLASPVTVDSLTFNTSAVSYTIANGGAGNITTNSISVLAGSHSINTALTVGNGGVFNVSSSSSLTATNVVDGVGYYHNVAVVGGGSLTVNSLNNAALDVNGTTLTTTAGNTGQYVYLEHGAVWNIDATSTIDQYYDDNSTTLNLASGATLYTQDHTVQIGGTLSGSGNLSLGGGPDGIDAADGYYTALYGTNSNYSGAITITGGGTLTVNTDANLGNGSATNTLNISNGTLNLGGPVVGTHGLIIGAGGGAITTGGNNLQVGSLTGTGTLNLSGGSTLTVLPQVVAANSSGGIRTLTSGGLNLTTTNLSLGTAASQSNRSVLVTGGLSLSGSTGAWTSALDLGGNDLIVKGGNLSTLTNQAKQGFASGTWQGSGGILSAAAAANSAHLTAIGVIQNSATGAASGAALYSTFDGNSSTSADVLVKYTYYGDANLNGKVDASDYSRIDNGYLTHLTGWYNGDFNYDGVVNGSDYTLIDNAFNTQGAQLSDSIAADPSAVIAAEIASPAGSSVPEPATLGLLGISAAFGLLGRRRERRHC